MNSTHISQLEALVAEKKRLDTKNTFFFRVSNYIFNFIMIILFFIIGLTITGYLLYYLYYEYDMLYIFQHLVDKNFKLDSITKPISDLFSTFHQVIPSIRTTNLDALVKHNFDPSNFLHSYVKKSNFSSYLENPIAYKEFFILKPEVAEYLNSYLRIYYIGVSCVHYKL